MEESYVIARINFLAEARSWTIYRLAKESGITYSTLFTMLHKTTAPSIPTLMKICKGFGISLSQFFDDGNDYVSLTAEEKTHLQDWNSLTPDNQKHAEKFIQYLLSEQ